MSRERGRLATIRLHAYLPWTYLAILAAINLYICRRAFLADSSGHWNSIHGQWKSLARLAAFDWLRPQWWPYWGGGAPLEFTYAPFVPAAIAALHRLLRLSPAHALNVLTAVVYCLVPVALYVLSWRLSLLPGYSFTAALICSLATPAALLIPDQAFLWASVWSPRRLSVAFEWDDLPHLTSLALLPLAVWALARALQSKQLAAYAVSIFTMAGMMLANMFGVVLTGIVAITVPLAVSRRVQPRQVIQALLTAIAAYVVISPWVPPSLVLTIRANASRNGEGASSLQFALAFGLVALLVWIVWRFSARYDNWGARWLCLFGCAMILIPAMARFGGLQFLPQPSRYKIEADFAIAWIVVFALRPVVERLPVGTRWALAVPLAFLAAEQTLAFEQATRRITAPVNVEQSIEYRSAKWVEKNLPGQRVMMGGSLGNFLNTFTGADQLSAQPYTTAPNWEQQIAVYTIYIGENAGDRDGEFSLLWLKAFGVQAVAVPGPRSPEYWKPFTRPRKFDGMLPVLWSEDDTTIYRVPQRSISLAHVMRPEQLVRHPPLHGLDIHEVRSYVEALESTSRPAELQWLSANSAHVRAHLLPGDIVSIQMNYHPGWHATIGGAPRAIRPDGIGLMTVTANCLGECEIDLNYDGGWESRLCRLVSGGTLLLLLAAGVLRYRTRTSPHPPPDRAAKGGPTIQCA